MIASDLVQRFQNGMEEDEWIISDQSAREAGAGMALCVKGVDKVWRWEARDRKKAFDIETSQRIISVEEGQY